MITRQHAVWMSEGQRPTHFKQLEVPLGAFPTPHGICTQLLMWLNECTVCAQQWNMFVCPLTDLDPDEQGKSHCVNGRDPMIWGKRMSVVWRRRELALPAPTPAESLSPAHVSTRPRGKAKPGPGRVAGRHEGSWGPGSHVAGRRGGEPGGPRAPQARAMKMPVRVSSCASQAVTVASRRAGVSVRVRVRVRPHAERPPPRGAGELGSQKGSGHRVKGQTLQGPWTGRRG